MSQLAEQLLNKSKEAFILAIEIYNKPTIKYRVEGFAFFICNAWELMLKAELLKRNESIQDIRHGSAGRMPPGGLRGFPEPQAPQRHRIGKLLEREKRCGQHDQRLLLHDAEPRLRRTPHGVG